MSTIKEILDSYNFLVGGIDKTAKRSVNRAYGGVVRSGKGRLVESITKMLLLIAWKEIGGAPDRISFNKKSKRLPINKTYVSQLKDSKVKSHIIKNQREYYYTLKTDVHCNIDDEFVLGVECKSFTENAMLKRILVDFSLMKKFWPNLNCFILQLESQLGGDYSDLNKVTYGSKPTHTLLSYFDVNLEIITLLKGERKINKPIHKPEYFKPLERRNLRIAIDKFKNVLSNYL